jgi:AAHS family 4-hydroxybenzoate transporter-like MFS transporter
LQKINPKHIFQKDDQFELFEQKPTGALVKSLFSKDLARNTILIWIIYFMNLLILYSLVNWLPSILKTAGFPLQKAIIATVLFNLGGIVGGIIIGRLIDRKDQHKILGTAFGLGAVVIAIIGFVGYSIPLLLTMVFIAGFLITGSLLGVQAITTSLYNTSLRSTGVGWAIGFGRIGSIIGPVIAGIMLDLKFDLKVIFIVIAIPAAVAAVTMTLLKNHKTEKEE